jgi:hypothetical protein
VDLEKRKDTGEWRKLGIEKLHNIYHSQNIVSMIKSWVVRGEGHVVRLGDTRKEYNILIGNVGTTRHRL